MTRILLCFGAYLLGSIPFSFLAARWSKGIDLRKYGSGTVSGSMVYEHAHRWLIVPVGILDVFKAAFPTWLAIHFGLGESVAVAAGICAVIGHNWPIFLGFTGGRGISPFLGVMLVLFPWGDVWLLVFLAIGYLFGDSAPWTLASLATLPLPIYILGESTALYGMAILMLIVTLLKRLEANRRPLPAEPRERQKVIWLRLVYDRDIPNHQEWIHRKISK
jgi:acyl phosphate:glycerol-3-phosphate acyltransferase